MFFYQVKLGYKKNILILLSPHQIPLHTHVHVHGLWYQLSPRRLAGSARGGEDSSATELRPETPSVACRGAKKLAPALDDPRRRTPRHHDAGLDLVLRRSPRWASAISQASAGTHRRNWRGPAASSGRRGPGTAATVGPRLPEPQAAGQKTRARGARCSQGLLL